MSEELDIDLELEELLKPTSLIPKEPADTSVYKMYSSDFGGPIDFDILNQETPIINNLFEDNNKFISDPGYDELIKYSIDYNMPYTGKTAETISSNEDFVKSTISNLSPEEFNQMFYGPEGQPHGGLGEAWGEALTELTKDPTKLASTAATIVPILKGGKYSTLAAKTAWDWVSPKVDLIPWPSIRKNAFANLPKSFKLPANLLRHSINLKSFEEFMQGSVEIVQNQIFPNIPGSTALYQKIFGEGVGGALKKVSEGKDSPFYISNEGVRDLYRSNYESWHLEKNPEFPMDANTQNIYNTVQKMIEYGETEYGVNFPVFQIVESSVEDKGGAQTVFGGWNRSDRIFIPSNFKERDISPALRDLGFKGDTGYIGGVLQEYIHSVKGNQFTLPGATLGSYAQIAKDMITIVGEEYSQAATGEYGKTTKEQIIPAQYAEDYHGAESVHRLFEDELTKIIEIGIYKGDKAMKKAYDEWYNKVGNIQHESFNLQGQGFFEGESRNLPERAYQYLWDILD